MENEFNLNRNIKKENFKISKNTKIFTGTTLGIILIGIISLGFYKHENTKFFDTVNTNISKLNTSISSFKVGLNQNAEFLNPSFITTYENDFKNLAAELQNDSTNFLNTQNSKNIINHELAKAKYYDYMAQFTQEVTNQKSNFEPLVNIMNNGGKLTKEQITTVQNAITTLINSKALTEAMNIYNQPNSYITLSVKSPYKIKQKLINLSSNLSTLDFKITSNPTESIWIADIL